MLNVFSINHRWQAKQSMQRFTLIMALLLVGSIGLFAGEQSNLQPNKNPGNFKAEFVEDEIIIQVTAPAAKSTGLGHKAFYGTTGFPALDALNSRYGVRSAEPVFKTLLGIFGQSPKRELQEVGRWFLKGL